MLYLYSKRTTYLVHFIRHVWVAGRKYGENLASRKESGSTRDGWNSCALPLKQVCTLHSSYLHRFPATGVSHGCVRKCALCKESSKYLSCSVCLPAVWVVGPCAQFPTTPPSPPYLSTCRMTLILRMRPHTHTHAYTHTHTHTQVNESWERGEFLLNMWTNVIDA
jgi:hypothetical protein